MTLSRLIWRLMPIAVLVWATRTGTVEWGKHFKETKGVVQSVATQMEMQAIGALIRIEIQSNEKVPTGSRFSSWLKASMKAKGKEGHLDHFGKPYRLNKTRNGYVLKSAGPDRRFGSRDDFEKLISNR